MRLILMAVLACVGTSSVDEAAPELDAGHRIPGDRLDQTWVVELATEEALAPFAEQPGWVALVMKRNLEEAVRELGVGGGLGAARAHADAAAMYRQAALLAAHSLVQTYGRTPQPTDPIEAQHLVAIGRLLQGEVALARASYKDVEGTRALAWREPWVRWTSGRASWPPDLSALPLELPEVTVGRWPRAGKLPHYWLVERHPLTGEAGVSKRSMADPSALVALALWHEAAARTAAGDQAALLAPYRAGYHLPVELPLTPAGEPLPRALLFGSDLLTPWDGDFLVALHGAEGAAAVDTWAERSLLAWLAQQARVEGQVDAEQAQELVMALRDDLMRRARGRTEGHAQGHHRQFADIAMVGALRSLALVAEVEGNREVSGLLRIRALELSKRATACPVGLLALAAWDASNRYPMRALDILHDQARRYPSLEVARYALDVLALRVSHEQPADAPGL